MSPGLIPRPASRRRLVFAATGLALLLPSGAAAADAPLRTINRDVAGNATTGFGPVAVSGDGREVIANVDGVAAVRDVEAGVTRRLVPQSALVLAASTDLRSVLLSSTSALVPSDTDGGEDLYLLDRSTGELTRVTDIPQAFQDGQPAQMASVREPVLSGDGKVVTFRLKLSGPSRNQFDQQVVTSEDSLWRLNRAAGPKAVKVREMTTVNQASISVVHSDAAGAVAVTNEGAVIGDRVVPLPTVGDAANRTGQVAVSADGRAVAVVDPSNKATVKLVSTSTGAVTSIAVPSWLVDAKYELLNASAAGVLVRAGFTRTSGPRDAIGFVNTRGGVTQLGGDIVAPSPGGQQAVSENLAFAAGFQYLAQLGSRPLPGTEPPASALPLSTWMSYVDTFCTNSVGTVTWTRASVSLVNAPRGGDPRTPASASVKVFKTGSPTTVYNAFSMQAGASRSLTVPRTGGWTYAATITFTNGSTTSGSVDVPIHPQATCPFFGF